MFLGEYHHTLDDKGRLTVPARFRQLLAEGGYVTKGFDRNLMVLRDRSFHALVKDLEEQAVTDSTVRDLARVLFANAEFVQPDKSGRILLPQGMRERNGLQPEGELVLVGVGNYFEIWTPENWAAHDERLQAATQDGNYFSKVNVRFAYRDD